MLIDHFPLLGLRLRTPRLELRLPSADELGELADLAATGIHPPDALPFLTPWSLEPPAAVALRVIQHHWKELSIFTPQEWALDFTVFHQGVVIGQQSIWARDLAVRREVHTGSWLGQRHQGQGFGTEMRAAVLHLAFAGLDAEEAVSSAFARNTTSLAVSRKLGYVEDGIERLVIQDELVIDHRMRLTRTAWEQHRTVEVTIDGLEPCRAMLGLT
ncbi:MAG TPA: GNAT family N-acetyltransferase [Pseudonocardiaceae bacterium]|nr:GNAT family N-acetyltransferase [Pseudonocardiaceae bacterium]